MYLPKAFRRQPHVHVVQRPLDELRRRAVLPAIPWRNRGRSEFTGTGQIRKQPGMKLKELIGRHIGEALPGSLQILGVLERRNGRLGVSPDFTEVGSLKPLEIGELQTRAERRFRIEWKIVRHAISSG
jgi:hypothetical protein